MSILQAAIRVLGNSSYRARREGDHSKANAYALVAIGFCLLPIPIIGIPLIVCGVIKLGQ